MTIQSENNLFIATTTCSLEDFLKTSIAEGKHIYCSFCDKSDIDYSLLRSLIKRNVISVSFRDGYTIYPKKEKPDN